MKNNREKIQDKIEERLQIQLDRANLFGLGRVLVINDVLMVVISALDDYNQFLLKNGYTDTDIVSEDPTALDEFLNT